MDTNDTPPSAETVAFMAPDTPSDAPTFLPGSDTPHQLRGEVSAADLPPTTLLTVVETIYHRRASANPVVAESSYCRRLLHDEQPYLREMVAGSQWALLDRGWIDHASQMHFRNMEMLPRLDLTALVNEQDSEATRRIVDIGIITIHEVSASPPGRGQQGPDSPPIPIAIVRPGESLRLEPVDLAAIVIRCRYGTARCLLSLFPR